MALIIMSSRQLIPQGNRLYRTVKVFMWLFCQLVQHPGQPLQQQR